MGILADSEIQNARGRGEIVIKPFDAHCLGGNSYDVHLGPVLKTYVRKNRVDRHGFYTSLTEPLDCKVVRETHRHEIGPDGFELQPSRLYLGATVEYTETHKHVPYLDGKSSIGRLGIFIHATAGRGDVGFRGHFTLEIMVVEPVRIYAGMPIGQLTYHSVEGAILQTYDKKSNAKYVNNDPEPQPSQMWRNFK